MNRFISSLYDKRNKNIADMGLPGDIYDPSMGFHDKFVLCRDNNGNPTAIYGHDTWDYNPYRTSAKKLSPFNFSRFDKEVSYLNGLQYKNEAKNILALMGYTRGGKLGKISASTLQEYFKSLIDLAKFCEFQNKNNPFNKEMRISHLLSNVTFCQAYIDLAKKLKKGYQHKSKQLKSILNLLKNVDNNQLGFCPASTKLLNSIRIENQGHPVIPCRIYMNLLDDLDSYSKAIYEYRHSLRDWILKCKDYNFAIGYNDEGELNFNQEWEKSGLPPLAQKLGFECSERCSTVKLISFIQYILKNHIHAYTGMRDQEMNRIRPGCIFEVERDTSEDFIEELEEVTIVQVISTTSKFTGKLTEASWLAPSWILPSIKSFEVICEALCELYEVNFKTDVNLLISSGIIRSPKYNSISTPSLVNNGDTGFMTLLYKLNREGLSINQEDQNELIAANEKMDFNKRKEFRISQPWSLSSHQWRRSLAFYAANSKLINLPSLAAQFKHLSIEMAKYYTRDNEKFLKIFLGKNFSIKQSDRSHVMSDYKMAIPLAVVDRLIADIFLDPDTVFGGVGSYASKQKGLLVSGDITIREVREDTLREVKQGAISYRETLLGGCTNPDPCNRYLAGAVTACLPCDGSVIQKDKLDKFIHDTKNELATYSKGSAEYVITEHDLIAAENYKNRKMRT
ncbi:hypothetical protein [Vibrio crassostreae]|uniref:hypothetical protein n=1 Tax=Vibrio crassostreae TaxID=246167 RepID=UPI000F4A537F|nr:hypothetical protein [Vibrio crassostreae]ROO74753.1 hypothetical protein EDB57_1190 [Vibrio crassostreae]